MMEESKYSSNDARLHALQLMLCAKIDDLISELDIDLRRTGKLYMGSCPIHLGDRANALNLYPRGDVVPGYWVCRTRHCEKEYKKTIVGFVRGCLTARYKRQVPFQETLDWCCKFVGVPWQNLKVDTAELEKLRFCSSLAKIIKKPSGHGRGLSREAFRQHVQIPAPYFVGRGWSKEILDKYDVGYCDKKGKPFYERCVVPVYDEEKQYCIGFTARSVFEKCKCGAYHNPKLDCKGFDPARDTKWRNSEGFSRDSSLYNYWFAKKFISHCGIVVLVESPGNVWRLEESGIHIGVAMFGVDLTDTQQVLLETSGAHSVLIVTDNDKAGKDGAKEIVSKLCRCFRTKVLTLEQNDLGECSPAEVSSQLRPILKSLER